METSYLKTLELDKIIARAAEGCVCKEAREMLLATQPQCDPDEVRYALEQTDAINTLLIKNGSPRFGGVENVSQLAARAVKGGVLSMGELLMVAGALRNFQNLSSWYGASEHDALPTDDLFYALAPQPGLEQQISSAILAPDAMADTASHTLNDLRKKIRATENSIRDRLESMVRNMDTSKYLQESVVSMRNGRYVVPVKSEYRGEVSGIIHDVSSTGATVFVEPQAVVEANARICSTVRRKRRRSSAFWWPLPHRWPPLSRSSSTATRLCWRSMFCWQRHGWLWISRHSSLLSAPTIPSR